jgi:hypothetical protein
MVKHPISERPGTAKRFLALRSISTGHPLPDYVPASGSVVLSRKPALQFSEVFL